MATPQSQPARLREGFIALTESLLSSLAEVFPECDDLDAGIQLFNRLIKGDERSENAFIQECHGTFSKHSERLKEEDEEVLFKIANEMPLLKSIDFRSKWTDPGFEEKSKKHFWQYLSSLKLYADLYCAVPTGILGKIETVASSLSCKLQDGELDLSKLDVREIGDSLLGQLSKEELKSFEDSLPSIFSSVSDIASNLSTKLGGGQIDPEKMMSTLLERQKQGGPLDVTSILQNIGTSMPLSSPDGLVSMMQMLGVPEASTRAPLALAEGPPAAGPKATLDNETSKRKRRKQP